MELLASGLHAMLCNAAIGLMVLAVYGFIPASCNEECTSSSATLRIQTACKQEDEDLLSAHGNLNICRKMAVMFKCAVTSLPNCYDYFEAAIFSMYFHSPYSCELSEQQIIELQSIHNRGIQDEAELLTTSSTDQASTILTSTGKYGDEDRVHTTHAAVSAETNGYMTGTPHNGSEAGNIPCGNGCRIVEEQIGSLENNGASWIVSNKTPLMALVVWWSRSLSWSLMS